MQIEGLQYRTVWWQDNAINIIDQAKLPFRFKILQLTTVEQVAQAIVQMQVRGAPAIGATGGFGLALAAQLAPEKVFSQFILNAKEKLVSTRPTAFDLSFALNKVEEAIFQNSNNPAEAALQAAQDFAEKNVRACLQIGEYGKQLIKQNFRILTHCNAGALATVDFGTALAPIRFSKEKNIFVYVDETRPLLQGSRLTAFELEQENIRHAIITDNAAGYFMQKKEIDIVITGADRIALNGDVANKIGTYEKAIVAKENNIPFYVAAPFSTIDFNSNTGANIPIEERDHNEVNYIEDILIANPNSPVKNPAFDITPARYITGIITEKGIFRPEQIKESK
ncbi:MAG: S-methyl-5-thioribose-1-phosphate isomerase [Candidatus Cloacimonadota bacterium]|nr:S-methyl-5-thioribose-1-phosphate isomerase [Candidatus Cloacimonadota bacterium]